MSVVVTFALLGLLGWAGSVRIVRAGIAAVRHSDFVRQARACGCRPDRLLLIHILPNLKPILLAQFWLSVPVFLLAEANLGLLGLAWRSRCPPGATCCAAWKAVLR